MISSSDCSHYHSRVLRVFLIIMRVFWSSMWIFSATFFFFFHSSSLRVIPPSVIPCRRLLCLTNQIVVLHCFNLLSWECFCSALAYSCIGHHKLVYAKRLPKWGASLRAWPYSKGLSSRPAVSRICSSRNFFRFVFPLQYISVLEFLACVVLVLALFYNSCKWRNNHLRSHSTRWRVMTF